MDYISDTTGFDARLVAAAALRTGLRIEMCEDLLDAGYTYIQGYGAPARWELLPNPANPRNAATTHIHDLPKETSA